MINMSEDADFAANLDPALLLPTDLDGTVPDDEADLAPLEIESSQSDSLLNESAVAQRHKVYGPDQLPVELLAEETECAIQSFTGRAGAEASSVYRSDSRSPRLALERHGASLAFDADTSTGWHGACGMPSAPWWLAYTFAEMTTVTHVSLTSDVPADYPLKWQLQGALIDGESTAPVFETILRVANDKGIGKCSRRLRQFRCDRPQTRTYEASASKDMQSAINPPKYGERDQADGSLRD